MFTKQAENNFEVFLQKFEQAWLNETLKDDNIIKTKKFYYNIMESRLLIYQGSHTTLIGRFEPDRSWMGKTELKSFLIRLMPDFIPYFSNAKNFITGKWDTDAE
jgi:hypothetical protein